MHKFPFRVLPSSTVYTFADTIEYAASTFPGDRGAAVIDDDGMLYGMHFFADDVSDLRITMTDVPL